MSYLLEYSERLQKILQKLSKKDSKRYEIIWKKINEIADSENIEHKNMISFEDFDHHDKIYLKRS